VYVGCSIDAARRQLVRSLATVRTTREDRVTSGAPPFIASHYTLSGAPVMQAPRFSFADRVAAAAAAGFVGIGLDSTDYEAMRGTGISDAELRHILDDHDIHVLEIEFHFDWALDGARGRDARAREATFDAMAAAFAPDHLNVGELSAPGDAPAVDVIAERFGEVCDRAAEHGTRVALEFLPWTAVPDLATASEIARRADRPNGGVLLDAWHYFRGRPDAALLQSLPGDRITGVQLDDADPATVGSLAEDTMLRRRLPGDGSFDLTGLVSLLDAVGVTVPFSVEILSLEHQTLPIDEAARRAFDTTAAVVERARRGATP
jgi:sugar phosphate isomerase/epimerase